MELWTIDDLDLDNLGFDLADLDLDNGGQPERTRRGRAKAGREPRPATVALTPAALRELYEDRVAAVEAGLHELRVKLAKRDKWLAALAARLAELEQQQNATGERLANLETK